MNYIDIDRMKFLFSFDFDTGIMKWKNSTSNRIHNGSIAGAISKDRYRVVRVDKVLYKCHRIIYCVYHNTNDIEQIDHVNHIRQHNAIHNLRNVTNSENGKNRAVATGVYYNKQNKHYIAEAIFNGKYYYFGQHNTRDEAISYRRQKATELGFHENHGKRLIT